MDTELIPVEKELVTRLISGDQEAFTRLYHVYAPGIYKVALKILKSEDQARDVVQEIFVNVWTGRSNFGEINSLRPYLHVMTRNFCFRYLKQRLPMEALDPGLERPAELRQEVLTEDFCRVMEDEIDRLPPRQREVFRLGKIDGLKHEAIGRALNISPNTVSNHMAAAIRSLRNKLTEYLTPFLVLFSFWTGRGGW